MNRKILWLALALTPLCALASPGATAAVNGNGANALKCTMTFTLSGWSVIYHAANGHGTVTCGNGKSMDVNLSATGAGLTVGKYKLTGGHGTFTGVTNISDILGTYGEARAHAGVVGAVHALVVSKGHVSLALSGKGTGWNIGAGISAFTISKAQ